MAIKSKKRTINLLEPINPPSDLWTTIYNWVFTAGRYLLVFVESVLLIVFFTRFVIDEIRNDLVREINDKVEILSNKEFRAQEIKYRNIQTLLSDVKTVETKQKINSSIVAEILSGIPGRLNLTSFAFNGTKISLTMTSTDLDTVKDYEYSLRQNTKYSNISVTVSKTETNANVLSVSISFNVNAN